MKFFVPGIVASQSEAAYEALFKTAREQLRVPITPKRIYRLEYVHDKRRITIQVGEFHPAHPRYIILAILESRPHIVITRTATAEPGPTIMVASNEITEIIEFTQT
jgi:hypothetical protein